MSDNQTQNNSTGLDSQGNGPSWPATPDVGSLIQKLLSSVGAYAATQNGGSSGSNNQSQVPPSQQIMQDVATKAYTKQLQAHADSVPHPVLGALLDNWSANGGTQAPQNVPQGSSPEMNADAAQSISAGPGTVQPQIQIPTGQPQSGQAQPSQDQQPVSIDDQIANINKQAALNVAKKNLISSQPQSFMQRFNQQFTKMSGGQTQAEDLANRGLIQKMAGAEPIQPKDVADLNARSYTAAMDAAHNGITAEAQKLTGLEDLYGKEQPNRNILDIAMGRESANQSLIRKNIENSAENISNHLKNLRTLVTNRPAFSSQGMNSQAQSLSNKISEGQTATNKQTGQKIVYKGGKWLNQ